MTDLDSEVIRSSLSEPELFAALVDRHGREIWRFLARRSDRDTADDVLADVFTAAFARRSAYQLNYADARPWLYGIARNCLFAHRRRQRRRAPTQTIDGYDDPWTAVDDRLDAANCAVPLRAALADLPADEREVLLLVAWEQLTPTEAAVVLDIPPGTARSRLHRARLALKSVLPTTITERHS
jgi:RNA polymerase sigma factor (sigma-70 family)